jgi:hypothetical protein
LTQGRGGATVARRMHGDDEFLARFESCAIPLAEWNHRAHLRVAYAYLGRHGLEEAIRRMRDGIRRANAAYGIVDEPERGYHETLTQTWMRILDGLRSAVGPEEDFEAFVTRHPYLLQRTLPRLFTTRERMMSPEAKRSFLPPDVTPFPGSGARGPPRGGTGDGR